MASTFSRIIRTNKVSTWGNLVQLHHIGSTAIPGLMAKPIIDMLGETARLLHEYINVRLEAVRSQNISPAVKESVKIHSQLWSLVESANKKSPQSVSTEIFAESVNELISVHSKRIQITSLGKIPDLIWLTLYIVTFISLGIMGYHSGLSGSKRSITTPCEAFTFAIVLLLIVDIDRPNKDC